MGTIEAEEVLTQDASSDMVHKRFRIPGGTELLTYEADNLDRAGAYTVIESLDGLDPALLCKRCFAERPTDG